MTAGIARCLLITATLSILAGCATPPPEDDAEATTEFEQINDPLEPANRWIFGFNEFADTYFLKPAAQGYRAVTPEFGRQRISDFLDNLKTPITLMNDTLQGNFSGAGTTLERFFLNTSFGVLGVMDVATPAGLSGHESDFGQTLGVWGIGEGPYLVLPFFGPSNPRDAIGMAADSFADPFDYYLQNNNMKWVSWTRLGVSALSQREAYLDTIEDAKRSSLDFYSTMRSLYRQRRAAQINDTKQTDDAPASSQNMSRITADDQSQE